MIFSEFLFQRVRGQFFFADQRLMQLPLEVRFVPSADFNGVRVDEDGLPLGEMGDARFSRFVDLGCRDENAVFPDLLANLGESGLQLFDLGPCVDFHDVAREDSFFEPDHFDFQFVETHLNLFRYEIRSADRAFDDDVIRRCDAFGLRRLSERHGRSNEYDCRPKQGEFE